VPADELVIDRIGEPVPTQKLMVLGDQLWERIARSVETIEERLRRTVRVLEETAIPYAVVGGNAVRIWVAQIDQGAVRATNDVDILVRPDDLERIKRAMTAAGFHYRQTAGVDMFVDEPDGSARNAVHLVLSGQRVRPDDFEPNPDVEPSESGRDFRTLPLERLVRMKLNSFRLKDKVHLLDMIQVGLIDETWCPRFPNELRVRLKSLIDNPNQ
jgi:hypothetical protein